MKKRIYTLSEKNISLAFNQGFDLAHSREGAEFLEELKNGKFGTSEYIDVMLDGQEAYLIMKDDEQLQELEKQGRLERLQQVQEARNQEKEQER